MENITEKINIFFKSCLVELYGYQIDTDKYSLHKSKSNDYQFNQINDLAKQLGLNGSDIATSIREKLINNKMIDSVNILTTSKNRIILVIDLSQEYLQKRINELYDKFIGQKYLPCSVANESLKILIDFSSPNIAKEMHVGHLRSTIIGESLCRVFEYCGHEVKRINHVGDWGTQFGMLIAYIKRINIDEYDISKLMIMYKESKKLFDSDIEFKKQAYMETVKLQQLDDTNITIWKDICCISMESFNKIYKQLGTHSETRGESFYQSRMIQMVKELDPILSDKDGMKILFPKGFDIPYILVKSDGGFTYDTSDLTALRHRIFEEKADKIIYVVDSGQNNHFNGLFQLAEDLGWASKAKFSHVGFGIVLGTDGKKIKTRSGESVKLRDLLEQAYNHALDLTTKLSKEKHPEWDENTIKTISNKIAINCIKYADLTNPRLNNYKFSLDKMLNVKGNTAVYLMYGMARCKAILRKVHTNALNFADEIDLLSCRQDKSPVHYFEQDQILLENESTRKLAFKLTQYSDIIKTTIEQLAPHHLCTYLYELIGLLTDFYQTNRCIEFDTTGHITHIYKHRVNMIYLCDKIISTFFHLIGLEHIEQI